MAAARVRNSSRGIPGTKDIRTIAAATTKLIRSEVRNEALARREHLLSLGADAAIVDGLVDTAALRPIARLGYRADYAVVDATFAMERPYTLEEARRLGYTPGSKPKEIARQLAQNIYGWGADQFSCYDSIIMRESEWIVTADNPTSSAYGIPQALPGKRMASEGADWQTNPATQIKWGLKYVEERYGTPCKAWSFKRANGWY